jgi:hypothetical protein
MISTNMHDEKISVGISFGGTKLAVGLVGQTSHQLLASTERIGWHPMCIGAIDPLACLLELAISILRALLQQACRTIENVNRVGIAWPGPGRYREGMLTATFIPGCATREQNIHMLVLQELQRQLGVPVHDLQIVSRLDANAHAIGEVILPGGAFFQRDEIAPAATSGIVLNIATGVAGAIVQDGHVFSIIDPLAQTCQAQSSTEQLGETYGQFGRYLFKRIDTGIWLWKPTHDGSIPEYNPEKEIRLTDLCGGPALTRRYVDWHERNMQCGGQFLLHQRVLSAALALKGRRNIRWERVLLRRISSQAYRNDLQSRLFVQVIGNDIGHALHRLYYAYGAALFGHQVVLTGGVGEFFGRPPRASAYPDLFLEAITASLNIPKVRVIRSVLGMHAELVGATQLHDEIPLEAV